jgi:hypothetical protein
MMNKRSPAARMTTSCIRSLISISFLLFLGHHIPAEGTAMTV